MFTRLRQIWLAALVTVVTSCVALTTSYTVYNRPTGHFHPYDRYERGFLADPYGYETRNTYQPPPKTASLRTSSRGDVTVSQVHDKRYDVTAGEYASNQLLHSSKGAGVDDVAVVYRKHLKQDYGGMSGSHGGGSYGSYSSYYGNGGDDYATRNAALPRYNTLSTNSGWISASTRGYGSSYGRSGSRHGNTLGREDVELIDSSKTVSSPARYSSGRGSSSGAKTYGYTEPSQTPGGGYAAALRPWYARRLEGKQAEDTEEETTRNPQENMIPRTLQPVILLAAYDPCLQLPDGNYPLTSSFQGLFPFVDQRCNFVKCAHRTAFINQCGIGTRNPSTEGYDDQTDDRPLYCSETDSGGLCRSQVVAADVSVDEYGTPVEGSTPINEGELGESFSADGIGV